MGRSMDPVAAARAAMDAAAAAEAAARAAAEAAEARSETTSTARPPSVAGAAAAGGAESAGLATTIGQQAVTDTGVGLPGGGILDDGVFAEVADRDLSSLGSSIPAGHDGLTSLPGLDASMLGSRMPSGAEALAGAMDRFDLDGGGSGGGAATGKGMIMDGGLPLIPLVGEGSYGPGGVPYGGGGSSAPAGDVNIGGWAPGSLGRGGSTGGVTPVGGSADTDAGEESGTDWGKVWSDVKKGADEAFTWENAGKAWHESAVGSAVDWVVEAVSGDDDDDDSTTGDGAASGSGASAKYQTQDEAGVVKPKGWIDGDDLLTQLGRTGAGGVVTGSRGGDPDGGNDGFGGRPGPQGGDTTGNPGAEGTYAGSIAGGPAPRTSAIDLVGQPDRDPDQKVALDPDKLQTISTGPGPEVINPGDGEAADAEAQASTAYGGEASGQAQSDGFDPVAADPMTARPPESQGWEHSEGHGGGHGHSHAEAAADETDIPEEV